MKTYALILLAGIGIAGEVKDPGSVVDVDESLAKSLLRRSKARVPTDEELRAAGRDVPSSEADDAGSSGSGSKASDGLNVTQLKAALDAKNINYPADAKKADLAALLDAAPAA